MKKRLIKTAKTDSITFKNRVKNFIEFQAYNSVLFVEFFLGISFERVRCLINKEACCSSPKLDTQFIELFKSIARRACKHMSVDRILYSAYNLDIKSFPILHF